MSIPRAPLRPVALITLAATAALFGACKRDAARAEPEKKKIAVPVQVFDVVLAPIVRALSYDADVQGELEVKVFAQVPERIVALKVEEGDQVKKGQVIAVLRADTLSESVRSAAAAVDAARADGDAVKDELGRAEKLLSRNIVAQAQVDQLRARLAAAEAQVRRLEALSSQASTTRGNAIVRAPISGVIGRRFLSQGDLAPMTLPIVTVVRTQRVHLLVEVPEQDLVYVREGMVAQVRVARDGDRAFSGKVILVSPTIDRQTRTARIKIEVDNGEGRLMSGMLARVRLEVERKAAAVVVPYRALVIESTTAGGVAYRTYVVEGQRAKQRYVKVGIVDDQRVEVLEGLKAGEHLVTKGQHLLDDGREVEVVEHIDLDGTLLQRKQRSSVPARGASAGRLARAGEGGAARPAATEQGR